MSLYARIDALETERDALDALLSPIYDRCIKEDGIHHSGFSFMEATTTANDCIVLYGVDHRDGEERSVTIPASVIEGDLDAWLAQRREAKEREKAEAEREAKERELERLEARTRVLRGELSDD
ncbi:hypothetical protein [Phaeobacter phage MD18]|nr:hypothetical protein [Phaeobacter phage MD18]